LVSANRPVLSNREFFLVGGLGKKRKKNDYRGSVRTQKHPEIRHPAKRGSHDVLGQKKKTKNLGWL